MPVDNKVVDITASNKPIIWLEYLAKMPPINIGRKFLNTVEDEPRSTLTETFDKLHVSIT